MAEKEQLWQRRKPFHSIFMIITVIVVVIAIITPTPVFENATWIQ